jgi:hypothetical protein
MPELRGPEGEGKRARFFAKYSHSADQALHLSAKGSELPRICQKAESIVNACAERRVVAAHWAAIARLNHFPQPLLRQPTTRRAGNCEPPRRIEGPIVEIADALGSVSPK